MRMFLFRHLWLAGESFTGVKKFLWGEFRLVLHPLLQRFLCVLVGFLLCEMIKFKVGRIIVDIGCLVNRILTLDCISVLFLTIVWNDCMGHWVCYRESVWYKRSQKSNANI